MDSTAHQLLGELNGKMDMVLALQADQKSATEKLSDRVAVLEHEKTKWLSYAACVSLVASIGAWFVERLWH